MLQPLGGAAESTPTTAPIPVDSPPSADGGVTNIGLQVNVNPLPGADATQELCEKANTESTLATLGYGLGGSLLALVIFVLLEKKMVSSGSGRIVIPATVGSLTGFALAYVDPARSEQFTLCLNDSGMAIYLALGTQPVARALAFGFAPALALTLIFCLIARRLV